MKQFNLAIFVVLAPTALHTEEEIDNFYKSTTPRPYVNDEKLLELRETRMWEKEKNEKTK